MKIYNNSFFFYSKVTIFFIFLFNFKQAIDYFVLKIHKENLLKILFPEVLLTNSPKQPSRMLLLTMVVLKHP